jgi:hypothetical protein
MKQLRKWLTGLLALQLVLAATFLWAGRSTGERDAQQPLLNLPAEDISRIVIREGEQETSLTRTGDSWQLPTLHNLPAKQANVDRLLDKLAGLRAGWPVATSQSSHARFQVAEDDNQRHIRLYQGDKLAGELFLGSSPGLRQVHLRLKDDDAVYTGEVPTHEVPAKVEQWLDKSLLAASGVEHITGEDFSLEKADGDWAFAEADEDTAVNAQKAKDLATALESLQVSGVAQEPPTEGESVTLSVKAGGKNWQYTFTKADDQYYVRRNDRDAIFTLTQFNYDRIAPVDRVALAAPRDSDSQPETAAKADDKEKG